MGVTEVSTNAARLQYVLFFIRQLTSLGVPYPTNYRIPLITVSLAASRPTAPSLTRTGTSASWALADWTR